MKSNYLDLTTRAIVTVDLFSADDAHSRIRVVTRTNTPEQHRNQGLMRALIAEVLHDADTEGITLWLNTWASGRSEDPDDEQLIEWYKRLGFTVAPPGSPYQMVRTPVTGKMVNPIVAANRIILKAAEQSGYHRHELLGHSRLRPLTEWRQVTMWAIRESVDMSFPRIGALFDGRDHTTVQHACKKVANNPRLLERGSKLL